MKEDNLVGQRFNRLLVLAKAPYGMRTNGKANSWICACDCGGFKVVQGSYLKSKTTMSCGCLFDEVRREAFKDKNLHKDKPAQNSDVFDFFFRRPA